MKKEQIGNCDIDQLISNLGSDNTELRLNSISELGRIGIEAEKAVPSLILALEDTEKEVREGAAWVLGRIGPKAKDAIPKLVEALRDDGSLIRFYAVNSLGEIGEASVPALMTVLNTTDNNMRIGAVEALGRIGPKAKDAVPILVSLLKSEDNNLVFRVARVLGLIGLKKNAISALKEKLQNESDIKLKFTFAFSLASLENGVGEGTKILEEMRNKGILSKSQEQSYDQLCKKLKIVQQIDDLKGAAQISGNTTLYNKVEKLELLFSENQRMTIKAFQTTEQFKDIFANKDIDYILKTGTLSKGIEHNKETIENLERNILRYIERLEKKVDNELKNKNIMEGLWKGFVIGGSILSVISLIASIILIVLKIIETSTS